MAGRAQGLTLVAGAVAAVAIAGLALSALRDGDRDVVSLGSGAGTTDPSPTGCWDLGGGWQFVVGTDGAGLAFEGTEMSFAPGLARTSDGPAADLSPEDYGETVVRREASGWTNERILDLIALTSAYPEATLRSRLGGALLSDQEIEDRLEHTTSLLALTPACAGGVPDLV
jgi:hypothetical protein